MDSSELSREFHKDQNINCGKCPAGEMLPKVDHTLCSLVVLLRGRHVLVFARRQWVLQLSPALLS